MTTLKINKTPHKTFNECEHAAMADLKTILDFMLDYGGSGSLPNMDAPDGEYEGGSGHYAYEATERLAKENFPELFTYWVREHTRTRLSRAANKENQHAKV